MKIGKLLLLYVSICVFMLCGCDQAALPTTQSSTPTTGLTPAATTTSTATLTLQPSATFTVTPTETLPPTQTVTALPSATPWPNTECEESAPYVATWSSFQSGMHFEGFLCPDETFVAVMRDQEIPEYITINLRGFSNLEYFWGAMINVDGKVSTGMPDQYHYIDIPGVEYELVLAHWSNARTDTKLFEDKNTFQVNVWKMGKMDSYANMFVDRENKRLTLRGKIHGMDGNSEIRFVKFYRTAENKLNYKTDWIKSDKH